MAKYILLSGIHSNADGTFMPGDVVTSDSNLSERFPERFEPWQPGDDDPGPEPEEEEGD